MNGRGCIEVRETEVVNLWCTVGASEDLATDADVTRFLLAVYFADSNDGKKYAVRCAGCKSSLTPLCYTCRSDQAQELVSEKTKAVSSNCEKYTDSAACRQSGRRGQSKKYVSPTITTVSRRGRSRSKLSDPSNSPGLELSTNKTSSATSTANKYSDDEDASWNAFEADGDESETDVANDSRSRQSSKVGSKSVKRTLTIQPVASEKNSNDPSDVEKSQTSKGSAVEKRPKRSSTRSAIGERPVVLLARCDEEQTESRPHEQKASFPLPQQKPFSFRKLSEVLSVTTDILGEEGKNLQFPEYAGKEGVVATFDQYWSGRWSLSIGKKRQQTHRFCQDCNSVFETQVDINAHRRTEGACAKDPSRPVDERSKQILVRNMEKYLHCCHECKLVFSQEKYLKGHLDTHSASSVDDVFVALIRSRETINKKLRQDFDSFMGFTTGKYPLVGETIYVIRPMANHLYVYYNSYSCSLCQKVFTMKNDLLLHMTRPTCEGEDPPLSMFKKETTRNKLPIQDVTVEGKRRSAQAVRNYSDLFTDDVLHDPNDMVSYSSKANTTISHDAQEKEDSDYAMPSVSGLDLSTSRIETADTPATENEMSDQFHKSAGVEGNGETLNIKAETETSESDHEAFDPHNIAATFALNDRKRKKTDKLTSYAKFEKKRALTLTQFMTGKHTFGRIGGPHAGKKSHLYCPTCNTVFPVEKKSYVIQHRQGRLPEACPSFKGIPPKEELDAESVEILKQVVDELLQCCPLCDCVFVTDLAYKDHLLEHIESDSVYKCRFCSQTFPTAADMMHHLTVAKHKKKCKTCGEKFSAKCQRYSHSSIHPPATERKCKSCGEIIALSEMDEHKKIHKRKPRLTHLCAVCGKACSSKDMLKTHMLSHTEERPFPCFCGKAFKSRSQLRLHQYTHAEKTLKCNLCPAVFGNPKHLSTHVRAVHVLGRRFKCEICAKGFMRRTHLKYHMDSHNKTVKCEHCDLSCANKTDLHIHMRRHTGEKPFQCSQCPKRFSRRDYLRKHKLYHTGHMPYSCSDCHTKFREYTSYKQHRQKHHPKSVFSCDQCGQTFAVINSLNYHKRQEHEMYEPGASAVLDEAVVKIVDELVF